MNIVLLGAPGAGKDTLADQLSARLEYKVLAPGSILRREADLGTPLGLKAKNEYWGKGNLCPNDMINNLVKNTFDRVKPSKVIFNGYPRSANQAKFLEEQIVKIDFAIDLDVSEDAAVKRLLLRRREDDTEEVIRERFRDYHANNSAVVDFYKQAGVYTRVDGNQMIPRVLKEALAVLGE